MPFVDLDPAPPNPAKESRPLVVALGQKRTSSFVRCPPKSPSEWAKRESPVDAILPPPPLTSWRGRKPTQPTSANDANSPSSFCQQLAAFFGASGLRPSSSSFVVVSFVPCLAAERIAIMHPGQQQSPLHPSMKRREEIKKDTVSWP